MHCTDHVVKCCRSSSVLHTLFVASLFNRYRAFYWAQRVLCIIDKGILIVVEEVSYLHVLHYARGSKWEGDFFHWRMKLLCCSISHTVVNVVKLELLFYCCNLFCTLDGVCASLREPRCRHCVYVLVHLCLYM